jgi:peptidylprolyl isomerase
LAREGFYDGLTFHRIVPGFVIQAGDPLGDGTGGPGYSFAEETGAKMEYVEGTLAMAKGPTPGSTGSQWFIVSGPDGSNLDATPEYTIFGKVVEGLDVVAAIDGVEVAGPNGDTPTQAVYVDSVTIRERPIPEPEPSDTGAASPSATDAP